MSGSQGVLAIPGVGDSTSMLNMGLIGVLILGAAAIMYFFYYKTIDKNNPRIKFAIFEKGTYQYPVYRRLKDDKQIVPDDIIGLMLKKHYVGFAVDAFKDSYMIHKSGKLAERVYFGVKLPDGIIAPMRINVELKKLDLEIYQDAKRIATEFVEIIETTERNNSEMNPLVSALIPSVGVICSSLIFLVFLYLITSSQIQFMTKQLAATEGQVGALRQISDNWVTAVQNARLTIDTGVSIHEAIPLVNMNGTSTNSSVPLPNGATGYPKIPKVTVSGG